MLLSKLCIYVNDLNEFVEIQQYMFSQDIIWSGNGKKLFRTWADGTEIEFPRNLMVGSNRNMFNSGMEGKDRLNNDFNLRVVNCRTLLRKFKLKKLDASNL